jgi:hypothetical protein
MTDAAREWHAFDGGATMGTRGSEHGIILCDEEHGLDARITLERDGSVAPFSITCGVYGLMLHTRFFEGEDEARTEFAAMKVELARLADGEEGATAERFVRKFPT